MASNTGFTIAAALSDGVSKEAAKISRTLEALQKSATKAGTGVATITTNNGLARAADGMKSFGDQSLGAARAIERMIPGMQLLTAAGSLTGLAALTRGWADAGNAIGKTANLLQAPVETISALRGAARLAGSSADAMDQSLQGLNETLSAAHWNRPDAKIALLNQLGIGFHGVAGKARTAADAMGDVAEQVTARNNDPDAQKRLLEQLGMSPDLLPLLNKGRKGLEDFRKQAEATGGTMTGQMAADATKLKAAWEKLSLTVEGVGNRIVDHWSGTVTSVLKTSSEWIEKNQKTADSIAEIGTAVMAMSVLKPAAWVLKLLGLGALVPSGAVTAAAAAGVTAPATAGADITTGGGLVAGSAQGLTNIFSQWLSNRFGFTPPGVAPPSGPRAGPRAGTAGSLDNQTVTRARAVHDGLMAAGIPGMNDNLAWGFAGNSVQESNANPNGPPGDRGAAHGLMMWRDGRLDNFKNRYGHLPEQGSLTEAIDFIKWELTNSEAENWRRIRAAGGGSPGEAGAAVSDFYERPKDTVAEEQRRWALSQQLAGMPAPGDTPPPAQAGANGNVHVTVDVRHNGTAARATAVASGSATTAPPRIETPLPYAN